MYLGRIKRSIDSKGRLMLPAKYRTNLIKEIKTAETYPYESISLSSQKEKITQNVFGGNVGVGFDFLLSTNFAFFLKGHYFFGKANFDPAGEIPTLSLSLIGGQIGGGIKLRF